MKTGIAFDGRFSSFELTLNNGYTFRFERTSAGDEWFHVYRNGVREGLCDAETIDRYLRGEFAQVGYHLDHAVANDGRVVDGSQFVA